ncbi:MBL fold metallo-hydrolase [Janthinobacterium sp. 17J80-10]|uniref:MBL fold metallo-hydrolase RNA specificity domain-containing protein n=1 Tax=Janthinobacterium sp. 17J80-10 TaxID=2497863 RepID=UPI0010058BEF|nr:MBL fold metallo-hydrolase [Janthinobacterium sp. 17J80-10]QAU34647.1 MBL fold metallo-hydrolase [Janthinobacterium sp. 17J80-10]
MRIQFLGATGTVTGSKYLLHAGGAQILVDCGLFQGYKQLRLRNWSPLPVPPAEVDAVVLTHAHLDHSGYLPLLVRQGFRGKIYCSAATYDLCKILLPDSGHLQEEDAAFANRHGFSKHAPALPLYTEDDAHHALKYFSPLEFGKPSDIVDAITAELHPAGHILGAAIVTIRHDKRSITFSGDLGRADDPIMPAPTRIARTDYLLVESTYGNRLHGNADPMEVLGEHIRATIARGGVVVIPAFAVGRAQELLYYIYQLKQAGSIPASLPVYLDSPMAGDATRIYHRHHAEHKLTQALSRAVCQGAVLVNAVADSMEIDRKQQPKVIISASGMATGGRVLHHLKAFAPDHRNTILFAGYQAGGTRGAAMLAGADTIKIHGGYVQVRAVVAQIDNLSAHADCNGIMDWLAGFEEAPKETFIVHGEADAADALRRRIQEELKWNCRVPEYLEQVEL